MVTYEDCGVSVKRNDELVDVIVKYADIDPGFAAAEDLTTHDMQIVQSTDGVGSKTEVVMEYPEYYSSIGQDLVAMCVNDILCTGASPKFFQDYIGMNRLDNQVVSNIILQILEACNACGVKLTGGEMAEIPGKYTGTAPELVGFATGIRSAYSSIGPRFVSPGDTLMGIPSVGPHCNGYSLIKEVLKRQGLSYYSMKSIMKPTKLYAVDRIAIVKHAKAIANITGGGLVNNIERALPFNLKPEIDYSSWEVPKVFTELQYAGDINPISMWETFNMGVGMVLVVNPTAVNEVTASLDSFVMGKVVSR